MHYRYILDLQHTGYSLLGLVHPYKADTFHTEWSFRDHLFQDILTWLLYLSGSSVPLCIRILLFHHLELDCLLLKCITNQHNSQMLHPFYSIYQLGKVSLLSKNFLHLRCLLMNSILHPHKEQE